MTPHNTNLEAGVNPSPCYEDPHSNFSDLPANVDVLVLCLDEDMNPPVFALTGLPDACANDVSLTQVSIFLNTVYSSSQLGSNEILPSETVPPTSSLLTIQYDMGNYSLTLSQSTTVDSNSSKPAPPVPPGTLDESVWQ